MTARTATFARRFALAAALAAGLTASAAALVACDQGEGARCQLDEDCKSGLVCNHATETCQATSGGDIDAAVPVIIDAAPIDTPPDVPNDVPLDVPSDI